jgi:hypothetical protein
MDLMSLPPRVKEDSSRVTATRRMNPRALTLVPWVPMRIILTVRSATSHFAGPHRQTSKATC